MGFCVSKRMLSDMRQNDRLRWYRRYASIVDDSNAFERSLRQPLPTCIRINPVKTTPERLAEILRNDGVSAEPIPGVPGGFRIQTGLDRPGGHWAFWAGLYSVMETVSMLPVPLLGPRPRERVLDLCAAPGGKALQIGWAMQNTGSLVANDRDLGRIQALRQSLLRSGLVNVTATAYDGVNYPKHAGYFDRVLVDAPCSCEGTVRKNPEVAGRLHYSKIRSLSRIQILLLDKAFQLCRAGGRIVYSTCTFAPEENEAVVNAVLRKYGPERLRLVRAEIPEMEIRPGITEWEGRAFHPSLRSAIRIWPHHNDTGGFFIAVIEKKGEQSRPCTIEKKTRAVRSASRPDRILQYTGDISGWTERVSERFGIPTSEWQRFQWFSRKPGRIAFAAADHTVPVAPESVSTGLPLMRAHPLYPKLSTAAAQLLGPHAVRNVVQLKREEIEPYMRREVLKIDPDRLVRFTDTGYVIVRHRETALGVGFLKKTGNGRPHLMESLFPKAWFES